MNDEGYLLIPRIQRRELSSYVIHRFFTLRYASWWAFLFAPPLFLKELSPPQRFTNNEYAQILHGVAYKDELFILPIK
jgi:hypothetical protein